MQTFTESSSCRECTWIFARVTLAASRLQLRGQDVFVLHTSNCGAAARAVGMNPKTSTQLSSRVDLVSPCLRARHTRHRTCTWHNGRLPQTLTGKDVNSFTPWDTSSTVGGWSFCFQEPLDRSFVSASKADTVPVSQELRVRRNHECQQTRCNISVPSSSPQTRPSR